MRRSVVAVIVAAASGAGVLLTALPAGAAGPWFVAPTTASPAGNNANSCLSAAAPCATVTGVLAKAGMLNGDVINVAAGTYTDRPSFTSKGAIIQGAGASTVFTGGTTGVAMSANLTINRTLDLRNLTLANGRGAIGANLPITSGVVKLTDVNVQGGTATNAGGGISVPAASAGSLTVTGGTFSNNAATNLGGAIYAAAGASVTTTGTTFTSNSSPLGGALYIQSGTANLSSTSFSSNSSTNAGGAIASGANITATGGSFNGNTGTNGGGAVYTNGGSFTANGTSITNSGGLNGAAIFQQSGTTTLTNATLGSNGSGTTSTGGAIYNLGTLNINGGTVSNNTAINGGAIINGGTATIDGTALVNNIANGGTTTNGGNAGAIYNAAALTVRNATFSGNRVITNTNATPGVTGWGGAIGGFNTAANAPKISIVDTTISGGATPSAVAGGGIAIYQNTVSGGTTTALDATGLTISGVTAGAASAIYTTGKTTLERSVLRNNFANHASAGNGGALYVNNPGIVPVVVLDDVDVLDNDALNAGGGIINVNGNLTIRNGSRVNGNAAPLGGGYYGVGPLTVADSEVNVNTSSAFGAGVYTLSGGTITDSDVIGNIAGSIGGGIVHGGGVLAMTGGEVSGNSAQLGGGAVIGNSLEASFDGTDFKDNTATSTTAGFGGGAVLSAGRLSISRATISGNRANTTSGLGAAVFAGTDDPNVTTTTRIDRSLVTGNESSEAPVLYVASTGSGSTNKSSITNSTIHANTAHGDIGAIQTFHPASIVGSTITGNTAVGATNYGAIVAFANQVSLSGSVLAGNSGNQCFQGLADGGRNIVFPAAASCALNGASNTVADPKLGALADNGGPTFTRLPAADSPALDKITAGTATGQSDAVSGATITLCSGGAVDQRGTARPQGTACDIGAVEADQVAPTVSGPASATYTVAIAGAPLTYTSTGSPQATLSATGLPAGVTLTDNGNGTATISGTPASGTGGVYDVTVTATNEAGSATTALTLTVNQAPALSGPSAATYTVGQPGGPTTFTSTGHPTSVLTSLGVLPGGVTFTDHTDGTGSYAGTPAGGSGGVYNLTVKAANGTAPDAAAPFALTVNEAPGVTGPGTATFKVGTTSDSAPFTASGFPIPSLSAAGLPGGLSLASTGPGSAKITGSAADGAGGVYPVTVSAANGVGSDATKSVSVTVNEAPELVGPDVARFVVGAAGSFTFASDGFPQATLTKTGSLPLGLTFADNGDGTARISGTASALVIGTYNITVRASNGVDPDATKSVQVQVVPQLAISTTSLPNAAYRTMYQAQLNATGGQPGYTWEVASGSLPAGLTMNSMGLITGSTTANPGTYNVTFRVTDSAVESQVRTKSIAITVVKGATTLQPAGILVTFPDNGDVNITVGTVEATLKGGFPQIPIAGATVSFKSGTLALCSALTNAHGLAKCSPSTLVWILVPLNGRVTATFAGNATWAASSGTAGVIR